MKPVTIIIPVYNAFDVTLECIQSVLATIPKNVSVCVIDDASPSGDLREFLPKRLRDKPNIRVLRNEINQGFVGTCNRGMLLESEGDVILLNSDTLVTPNWVQKLQEAAYSRPNVGTVTPLTNNGTICSVPCFLENNNLPDGYSLENFSALVEQLSEKVYVEAPTCVGFCTYVRRELLDAVGVFDPVFKQGYGEENDLSLRGKAKGFVDIIDDSTYIYHRGNMSFKEMRDALSEANSKILRDRYPNYEQSVAQFCSKNPLWQVQSRIWNALVSSFVASKRRTVLHLVHNGPFIGRRHGLGGTELHVQSLIRNDDASAHFSISPGTECFYLTAHLKGAERTLKFPLSVVPSLLSPKFFSVVHFHHSIGFDLELLVNALKNHGNYVVSIHDYHLLCGTLWLTSRNYSVCDGLSCGGGCFESPAKGESRRSLARKLLDGAARIVVFSESSKQIISRSLGRYLNLEVRAHGIELLERNPVPIPTRPDSKLSLKVLCLGTFVGHKGAFLIKEASASIQLIGDVRVEWHFLGRSEGDLGILVDHGSYTSGNLRDKIAEISPHVVLLAPQCQETYSITLDEAVWSGLPVISSPFGALPERIQAWGVGYVSDNSIAGIRLILEKILTDWPDFIALYQKTRLAPIQSVATEVAGYAKLYEELSRGDVIEHEALVRYLQPGVVGPPSIKALNFEERLAAKLRCLEERTLE